MTEPAAFFHVATFLDLTAELPFEFSPTLRLIKLDADQITRTKSILDIRLGPGMFKSPSLGYEYAVGKTGSSVSLPADQWRYYGITFSDDGSEFDTLQQAANVCEPSFSCFIHFGTYKGYMGWGWDLRQIPQHYNSRGFHYTIPPIGMDHAAVEQIKVAFEKLRDLDAAKFRAIHRAFSAFQAQKRLDELSDSRVLSIFAIIEMLLTHDPVDKGDSLTHQIVTKMGLVSRRYATPLDYSIFPSGLSEDKVWKKLYGYRSAIAHGDEVSFKSGQLSALVDAPTAIKFLVTATKRLLRHALEEPQLIEALRPV